MGTLESKLPIHRSAYGTPYVFMCMGKKQPNSPTMLSHISPLNTYSTLTVI